MKAVIYGSFQVSGQNYKAILGLYVALNESKMKVGDSAKAALSLKDAPPSQRTTQGLHVPACLTCLNRSVAK